MQREVEIERRSRLLSAAADDAAARGGPVGALVTCRFSSRRSEQSGSSGEDLVKIVRALHDVCGPELRRADEAHGSGFHKSRR